MTQETYEAYRTLLNDGALTEEEFAALTNAQPQDTDRANHAALTRKDLAAYREQLKNNVITEEEYTAYTGLYPPKPFIPANRNISLPAMFPPLLLLVLTLTHRMQYPYTTSYDSRALGLSIVQFCFRWNGICNSITALIAAFLAWRFYRRDARKQRIKYQRCMTVSLLCSIFSWMLQILLWQHPYI